MKKPLPNKHNPEIITGNVITGEQHGIMLPSADLFNEGYQAGLKRAVEICGMAQGPLGGFLKEHVGVTAKTIEQAILREAEGGKETS